MARRSGYTSQQPRVTGPGDVDRLRREVEQGLGSIALALAQLTASTSAAAGGLGADVAALADAPVVLTAADADFPNHRLLAVGSPITLAIGAPGGNALIDFDETVALGNNARVNVQLADVSIGTRRAINFIEGANIDITAVDDAAGEEVDVTIATTGVAGINAAYVTIGNDGSLTAERALTGSSSILVTDNGANSSVVLSLIDEYAQDLVAAMLTEGHGIDLSYNDGAGTLSIAVDETELDESLLDHGSLSGLADDDHTQYLLANGTRPLTGNWAVGGFDITGVDDFSGKAATLTGSGITTLFLSGASPLAAAGDGTGSPSSQYNKADAGSVTADVMFNAGTRRWIPHDFTTAEALQSDRYSSAGVLVNVPISHNASDTAAGATTSLADATIAMTTADVMVEIGTSGGNPVTRVSKSDAGNTTYFPWLRSAGTTRWTQTFDSNESVLWHQYDSGGAFTGTAWSITNGATLAASTTTLGHGVISCSSPSVLVARGDGGGSPSDSWNKADAGEAFAYWYNVGVKRWLFPYFTSSETLTGYRWTSAGALLSRFVEWNATDTASATSTALDDAIISLTYPNVSTYTGDGTGGPTSWHRKADASTLQILFANGSSGYRWNNQFRGDDEALEWARYTAGQVFTNFPLNFSAAATTTTLNDSTINANSASVAFTLGAGSGSPSEIIDADGTGTGTLSFLKDSASTGGKRIQHDTGEDLSIESFNGIAWLQVAEIENDDHTWLFHRQWSTPIQDFVPVGTTQTIDWDDGNVAMVNLGSAAGDVTLTLSNPNDGACYEIVFWNIAAESIDVVWPANVEWPGENVAFSTPSGAEAQPSFAVVRLVYDAGLDLYFARVDQETSVNGVAYTSHDFSDVEPSAPAHSVNVLWQQDGNSPNKVSAYVSKENIVRTAEATVDFGSEETDLAEVVVTGQGWVEADSILVATAVSGTTDHPDGEDDPIVEEIHAHAHTRSVGVGFTVTAHAPNGTTGQYKIAIVGAA